MRPKILIRFDDICPTMDYALWEDAMRIMDKYNVKPLIGVIPECKDPELQLENPHSDFWEYIKKLESKGYTIALHGLNHVFITQTRGKINNRFISEFAGLSLENQIEKIRRGKDILLSHDIKTSIFYAPAHSYDNNTIRALSVNGFKFMSDSYSELPYEKYGVLCLPSRPLRKNSPYCTAVFHAHEWAKSNPSVEIKKFEEMIKANLSYIVEFDEFKDSKSTDDIWQEFLEKMFVIRKRYIAQFIAKFKNR